MSLGVLPYAKNLIDQTIPPSFPVDATYKV
jgi:hypothetical protein